MGAQVSGLAACNAVRLAHITTGAAVFRADAQLLCPACLQLFPAGKAPHSAEEAQDMLEAGLLPGLLAGPGAGGSRPGAVKTSEESSWDSDSDMEG